MEELIDYLNQSGLTGLVRTYIIVGGISSVIVFIVTILYDYEIDDNGEVVPSLRQLDYNGGMSEMPLYVNFKKVIIELM